jgi:hypothetical protein
VSGLIRDVVAFEHCPGPVACDLHDDTFGDARSPQVADGGPAKIMEEQVGNLRSFASLTPTLAEVVNGSRTPRKQVLALPRLHVQKFRHIPIYRNGDGFRFLIIFF